MNEYNFNELSPIRFEKLVRDVLKSQYGRFENFSEGQDQGIDFRYSKNNRHLLIVQCKRYKDYKNLHSAIKKETSKLENIEFTNYLLVVSLDLTPTQKDKIFALLKNYLSNPNEIITRGDLNEMTQDNTSIIYEYPELWMKSINIHQKIFNIGILNHADFIKERLSKTLINFVPTENYQNILAHFKDNNVLIISGNPGVGKSTLAYATISSFIFHNEYKLIDITSRNIQEAEPFIANEEPVIFFIDDFLGQIRLEKNDDYGRLLTFFIEKIEISKNKKLLITTRNYILENGAKNLSSINHIDKLIEKYVIELKEFKRSSRTEILYNHLKNSNLDVAYIKNLLENDYTKIIDHPNFNPRIIDHLTKNNFLKTSKISSDNYYNFFVYNLENPTEIWQQFYENRPNDLYRLIIINKFLLNDKVSFERLEKCIMTFVYKSPLFQQYSLNSFEQIIRELNGTVFIIEDDFDEIVDEHLNVIEFHNPSIVDFLNSYIWKNQYWLKTVIENAIYFEQLFNWELTDRIKENDELLQIFKNKIINDFNNLENAGHGFFEFDIEDGGTSTSLKSERRNYFLNEFVYMFDIKSERNIADFVAEELFRYPFHGAEDTSEKILFAQICEDLIDLNIIEDIDAISNYTSGFFDDIKEFVYLEYLLRHCSKKCYKIIKSNKELIETADRLFVWAFEDIGEDSDYIDLIDLLDDYHQIKKIFPLRKTTNLLSKIKLNKKIDDSLDNLTKKNKSENIQKIKYRDIDDVEIESIITSLKL